MNKTLLVTLLLLPLACWAEMASSPQLLPVPDCFPCIEEDKGGSLTLASTKLLPVPDCFPCIEEDKG
ncbi:MAG: hypothetical protein JNM66_20770, partial [Bryobacterales bacterium]|nr:hypothetical protein [Bryobacterales bacterium]